jgi:glutathione S-transferase
VQRSVVTLKEKGVDFSIEYIDLSDKPDWFVDLSPLGKVPTLEVTKEDGERVVLFESVVINEYLDEVTEGRMLPEDPLARARARAYIEFSNAVLGDVFQMTGAMDQASLDALVDKLESKLDRLELELGEGPFFLGPDISLVDAAFLPALQRLWWSNELYPELASFEARPKLKRWWLAMADKPSVQASAVPNLRPLFDGMISRDRGGNQSLIGARVAS